MPVHTAPSYEGSDKLADLIADLDKRGERVVTVLNVEGSFVVITEPSARAGGRTEKRPAAKRQESR